MARKFTVTHEDGTVSKRGSANAVYPYAVEVGPADPAKVASALHVEAFADERRAAVIEAALVDPHFTIKSRGFSRRGEGVDTGYNGQHTYHNFVTSLAGTDIYCWSDSEGKTEHWNGHEDVEQSTEETRAALVKSATEQAARYRSDAARTHAKADAIASGEAKVDARDRAWGVLTWSSRRDLAEKQVASRLARWHAARGCVVRVVETVEVVK